MEKAVNIKAKTSFQPPLGIRKINSKCPKSYRPTKKIRTKSIENIGIKTRLSLPTTLLALIEVNLRPKPPKKINVTKETIAKVTQLIELILLKWQRKIRIRLRT